MKQPRPAKRIANRRLSMPASSAFVRLASFSRATKSHKSERRCISLMAGASQYIRFEFDTLVALVAVGHFIGLNHREPLGCRLDDRTGDNW